MSVERRSRITVLSGVALVLLALSSSQAHAARGSRSQACADRMADLAESVALTPTASIKLSAAERRNAEAIREVFDSFVLSSSPKSLLSNRVIIPELRDALKRTPQLLERDPDTALRLGFLVLFRTSWLENELISMLVDSGLRFDGATLSQKEVQGVVRALDDVKESLTSGLLARRQSVMELMDGEDVLQRRFEKARISMSYAFFKVVASQADSSARTQFRELLDADRYPMSVLLNRSVLASPFGVGERVVWERAFQRLFDATKPPVAVAHVLKNGRIRVSASDPFEGATSGLAGFERTYRASDLRALAESTNQDMVLRTSDANSGGFRISRKLLDELESGGRAVKGPSDAPPYDAWSRDGKIQGLIWSDTGFEAKDAAETLGEYVAFYRERGFQFRKQPVADFREWIQSRVKSGELDYMVREGHRAQVLRMNRSGELMIGRKLGKPPHEVVIFLPNSRTKETELTWSDLSGALNTRAEAHPESTLLYVDTKCDSFSGTACNLPHLAKSSQIQVVGAQGSATTFVNDDTSPLRAMMEALLEQGDYSTMSSRAQTARKKGDATGDDDYVFPNSDKYRKKVAEKEVPGGELEWVAK